MNYIIKDGKPVLEPDLLKAAQWREEHFRIALTEFSEEEYVSTVFLGIDHNHRGIGAPILYETMIFGGAYDGYQERYCTEQEASEGHERAVRMVKTGEKLKHETR